MHRRRLTMALLLGVMAGCSGGTPGAPAAPRVPAADLAGGTRLKVNWYTAPGGGGRPALPTKGQFHDTLLGVDCDFEVAGDGVTRCLPHDPYSRVTMALYPSHTYADPACTSTLIDPVLICGVAVTPALLSTQGLSTCPAGRRLWAVGAAQAAGTWIYRRDAAGTCYWFSTTPLDASYHSVGAELDYTAYVSAVARAGVTRGGYTEIRLEAEDGAVQLRGFSATGSQVLVLPAFAYDGEFRLLPVDEVPIYMGGMYADAACTQTSVLRLGTCTGPAPSLTNQGGRVYSVGAPLAQFYEIEYGPTNTCRPVTAPGRTGFPLGAEVPLTSFPMTPLLEESGRMVRYRRAVGSEWSWASTTVFDTTLGRATLPQLASDGLLRWLPYTEATLSWRQGAETWYFSDAGCSVRLASNVFVSAPDVTPLAKVAIGCDIYEIRELARFTGVAYQRTGPFGMCDYKRATAGDVYTVGAEIPPATFAPSTLERR